MCFCLFNQKAAYEMRISDWSSDVCSSDLEATFGRDFVVLLDAKREQQEDVDRTVAGIIAETRKHGDAALIEYTSRFDRLQLTPATIREIGQASWRKRGCTNV